MLIIIISGANQSGKDQFVEYFIKHYEFKAINMSTIDKIKEISKKHFGWNGKKTEAARKFLAEIKRVWAEFNNGPFIDMTNQIKNYYSKLNKKDKKNFVFFVHCREPEEIQKFKEKYKKNCLAILLKRDERPSHKKIAENHADMGVNDYNYDKIIINNGTKIDLELETVKFIEYLEKIRREKNIKKKQTKKNIVNKK